MVSLGRESQRVYCFLAVDTGSSPGTGPGDFGVGRTEFPHKRAAYRTAGPGAQDIPGLRRLYQLGDLPDRGRTPAWLPAPRAGRFVR